MNGCVTKCPQAVVTGRDQSPQQAAADVRGPKHNQRRAFWLDPCNGLREGSPHLPAVVDVQRSVCVRAHASQRRGALRSVQRDEREGWLPWGGEMGWQKRAPHRAHTLLCASRSPRGRVGHHPPPPQPPPPPPPRHHAPPPPDRTPAADFAPAPAGPPSPPAPAFRSPLVLERALFRPLVRERAVFRPTWRFATPRNLQCISVSRNARGRARKSGAFQGKGALAVQKNNHESLGRTRKGSGGRNRRTRWRWRGRCSS